MVLKAHRSLHLVYLLDLLSALAKEGSNHIAYVCVSLSLLPGAGSPFLVLSPTPIAACLESGFLIFDSDKLFFIALALKS